MKNQNKTRKFVALAVILLFSLTVLLSSCSIKLETPEATVDTQVSTDDPPKVKKQKPTPEVTPAIDIDEIAGETNTAEVPDDTTINSTSGGSTVDDVSEETPAQINFKVSDYAEMPGSYGKDRNGRGYTSYDARDVSYNNFLKLQIGMSPTDVKAILSDSDYTEYSNGDSEYFASDVTKIIAEFKDNQLQYATYNDYYRVCVDGSDISMAKFKQLKEGMSADDVIGILGKNYFISRISATNIISSEVARWTWFNEKGEIEVVFNSSGNVIAYMQAGLQYIPDARGKHPVLTEEQLMSNFSDVELGMDYAKLEEVMDNYIPLLYTTVNMNFINVGDCYRFQRDNKDTYTSMEFNFKDGKLYDKNAMNLLKELLPETNSSSAEKIKEGMTYDAVKALVGEGYMIRERILPSGEISVEYNWRLPGDYDFVSVVLEDGEVDYIYISE